MNDQKYYQKIIIEKKKKKYQTKYSSREEVNIEWISWAMNHRVLHTAHKICNNG